MFTLAKTENSDDERWFGGGDCSPSLVLSSDLLLNGNVLDKLNDGLPLVLDRRAGLMPGDLRFSSGHFRG